MHQNYFSHKTIWITGASSGIGAALARALAAIPNTQLILSGRNVDRLQALQATFSSTVCLILPFDITSRSANHTAVERIKMEVGKLDIAIFNAGASEPVQLAQFDSMVFERMMAVNYYSLVYAIEAALPLLQASTAPHLVGMSSLASYAGMPGAQAYCAAKAAARSFLQGLRCEVDFPVTTLCPGFVNTPLTQKNTFPMPFLMPAEKAATIILKGIAKQKQELHFPLKLSLPLKLVTSLPNALLTTLVRRFA